MSRPITFRPLARRDVLEQMLYLEERSSEDLAVRYQDAVLASCRLLAEQPLAGASFLTNPAELQDLRRFPVRAPFEKYLIFYQPRHGGIEIVRVLHGSRDLDPILAGEDEH